MRSSRRSPAFAEVRRIAGATALLLSLAAPALTASAVTASSTTLAEAHAHPFVAQPDAVALLQQRIARGEIILAGDDQAVLRTILAELKIPAASQVLVFSRTSLQGDLIRPATPRALYFSDSTYVGWIPDGLIEIVALDPRTGGMEFYTLDPKAATQRNFVRDDTCMRCHGERGSSRDVPRVFAQSIVTTDQGEPLTWHGVDLMDDKAPFERRWAGWYVTGYTGELDHRGNAFGRERDNRLDFTPTSKRPHELGEFFDTARYLAPTSDVVALLVFEHQMAVHNSLAQAVRIANQVEAGGYSTTGAEVALRNAARDVIDHLLFRQAAPLPEGIQGSEEFLQAFAVDARPSKSGRSLKELSLQGRLFANPCSYLVYSDPVLALPPRLKNHLFTQLATALHPDSKTDRYQHLTPDDKARIREILRDTHPDFRES